MSGRRSGIMRVPEEVQRQAPGLVRTGSGLDALVAESVRRRIITLEYRPGTMIFENAVSREFSVSRTPVHQAFLRLAHEELLTILPQRGALVSFLSRETIRHAQYVREALEAAAFADVARAWDAAEPAHRRCEAEFERHLAGQREAIDRRDYLMFTEHDDAFHQTIVGLLGNPILLDTLGRMRNHLNRVRYLELQEEHHEEQGYADHLELVQLIRANKPEAARRKLIAHLKMLEPVRDALLDLHKDLFE